jgi:tripartite-type tricarboxylate transporter receptor subunit TctC
VTTLTRLGSLPEVPTLDEQGLKGFEVKVWHGMYAPKGTPREVVDKLNAALKTAMADPAVKKRLDDLSSDIPSADKMSPEGLRSHLQAEINRWGPVIKKAGIYAD